MNKPKTFHVHNTISLRLLAALLSLGYSGFIKADIDLPASTAHGLELLAPANRWVTRLETRLSGYTEVYDANGNRIRNADAFDQVDLNADIFPALALLGPGASLGTTGVSSKISTKTMQLTLGYGMTPDLTVGVILPWRKVTNKVSLKVANGTTGLNTAFDSSQPVSAINFPFAPVGAGANSPLDASGMQTILTQPAFGLAYKPLRTTTVAGLADPTVGALWRPWKGQSGKTDHSVTLGMGVRLGISPHDDPDNLADVSTDDGSTDLMVQLETTHQLGDLWDLRLQAKHTRQTEDRVTVRVARPGELLPAYNSREKVKRDLGDFMEYDIEIGRRFGDWRVATTWHRWDKQSDRYRSLWGTDTTRLEQNTRIRADQWRLSLSWSGIEAWKNGDIPIPVILKLETQKTYQGINMPNVWDVYLQATTFF